MIWRRLPFLLLCSASYLHAADFAKDVYPVLQKGGCAGCHNADGVASATRFQMPEAGASANAVARLSHSLGALIDRSDPEKSLLLQKPTKRVAHAGGKRIEPGSPEEATLKAWIVEAAKGSGNAAVVAEEQHEPSGPVLRRLTHAQYNNTVRDLLGDDSRVADSFPPEDFVNGFRNQYQAQNTSPLLAEAYTVAAEKLAKKAFAGGESSSAARNPRIVPCKPSSAADAACRAQFVKSFGRRAFRRPLTPVELDRYSKLFAGSAGKSFYDGARTVAETMLQSPNFLLRAEHGLDPKWRPYETASQLSYFLWNTMPDEALLTAAEKGELATADGVERSVRRMLKDDRARQSMNEFLAEWLRFDRLLSTVKDRRTYPLFTAEVAVSMAEETRRLFSDLVWKDRNFMEFYSAEYSFLSSDLANVYGLKTPPQEYAKVELPVSSGRGGVLGQGTFLVLTSKPVETSPTARGLFVREQFLCQEVPQPPPGVNTNLPALNKAKPMTNRERLAMHLNNESCAGCHQLIDPIGLGFEKYDAAGQQREKQKITFVPGRGEKEDFPTTVEIPLDTKGHVAGITDSAFSTPRELGKILAASAQCQECVVKQVFRYAAGRHETAADRVTIRKAYEMFKGSDFRFQEMLVALTKGMIFGNGEQASNGVSAY
ncbi:MAG TPA: DUF1592 domain-containing protein [Bryobacteraceae bacterium]|nr:DUF1592 domain-containing protein [Bryobacteraceae bacterium]